MSRIMIDRSSVTVDSPPPVPTTEGGKFRRDFEQWRSTRAEYKALCKAVKSEAKRDELAPLAAAAGITLTELSDLRTCRAQALGQRGMAGKLSERARTLKVCEAAVLAAEKAQVKATAHQYAAACEAVTAARAARDEAAIAHAEAQNAMQYVELVEGMGLI